MPPGIVTPVPDCTTGQQKYPLDNPMAPKPHPHPTHSLTSPALPKLGCYESSQRRGKDGYELQWPGDSRTFSRLLLGFPTKTDIKGRWPWRQRWQQQCSLWPLTTAASTIRTQTAQNSHPSLAACGVRHPGAHAQVPSFKDQCRTEAAFAPPIFSLLLLISMKVY